MATRMSSISGPSGYLLVPLPEDVAHYRGWQNEAAASADETKALHSISAGQIQLPDYDYYASLTAAALYENATTHEKAGGAGPPDGAPGTIA